MKKAFVVSIAAFFFSSPSLFAQEDTVQARIVIIGDAGSLHNGRHYVVAAVKKTIKIDEKTTIVFVRDNLYYTGLPDDAYPYYDVRRAVLDSQVTIAEGTDAKVYFMPGNHDCNREGP